MVFQSTPPVKAATVMTAHTADDGLFQSTPPVKAATSIQTVYGNLTEISIHAAREGGDAMLLPVKPVEARFQSTPPVKAATF